MDGNPLKRTCLFLFRSILFNSILFPRPRPAFHRLQYGKAWGEPGNEAREKNMLVFVQVKTGFHVGKVMGKFGLRSFVNGVTFSVTPNYVDLSGKGCNVFQKHTYTRLSHTPPIIKSAEGNSISLISFCIPRTLSHSSQDLGRSCIHP